MKRNLNELNELNIFHEMWKRTFSILENMLWYKDAKLLITGAETKKS